MSSSALTPQDDDHCGWFNIGHQRQPRPAHRGQSEVDWAVVGAGLTGLAAARQLALNFPNDEIALIEAQTVGYGASGRNSGFAIDLPHNIGASDYIGDPKTARLNLNLNKAAQVYLNRLIDRYQIDCDFEHSGKYQAAVENKGVAVLDAYRRGLDKLGEPYDVVDGADLPDHIGTSFYQKALYTPGTKLLQPANLVKALAETLPDNVTIYENTPIQALEPGTRPTLRHADGALRANKVVLSNNAFATQLGFLRNRILPIFTYASLSRPLTDTEQQNLGGKRTWGIIPAHPQGSTLRRTADQRLLIRNTLTYNPTGRSTATEMRRVARHHRTSFDRRFPELTHVTFDYTWGGAMGLSRNHKSFFGELGQNVYGALAANGLGLTRGTMSGVLLANWLAGQRDELIDFLVGNDGPSANPPNPFLSWGIKTRLACGRREARLER